MYFFSSQNNTIVCAEMQYSFRLLFETIVIVSEEMLLLRFNAFKFIIKELPLA